MLRKKIKIAVLFWLEKKKKLDFYKIDEIWGKESFALIFVDNYDFFTFKKISENKTYVYFSQLAFDAISSGRKTIYHFVDNCDLSGKSYLGEWSLVSANLTANANKKNSEKKKSKKKKEILESLTKKIESITFTSNNIYYNNLVDNTLLNPKYKFYQKFKMAQQYSFFLIKDGIEYHCDFIIQEDNETALLREKINTTTISNYYRKKK